MTCALCVKHASPTTSDGTCAHEHITAVGEAISRRVNTEREALLARQHAWENGGREAWLKAHDYPRCEHGLHTLAICEDCRGFEVPASAFSVDGPDAKPIERCPVCGGSGSEGDDICPGECWGSGKGE